ncbi:MAG: hypothetical protein JRM79_00070 [Nitrososphaerota archaeon]|nr:hypothetical protein [Nitrososphaerota archaeon]MDG6924631.1 hypothetical protein [Nitrososphaerota archaeon]MDG6941194.1 hypothetical protein [Nitrososphaerota archaeon]MDG6945751.1 hypothetical protein [Nitrososphaerota archaeon]MDG6952342.1 hypothetical protein [Nitrososphaerota archaeon]
MSKQVSGSGLEVRGNTLRVYLYVLQHGPCELKDVQSSLGFSTASLASYHLRRLMDGGYATQDSYGRYLASKDATGEILEGYVKVGAVVVPQLLFVSVLFTLLVGYFSIMAYGSASYVPLLIASSLALVAVAWYETARVWRRLASWK